MGLSGIKTITTLSGCSFYKKIMQKYQTSKKNTSGFPNMIFYKGKNSVSPKKFDIILKFNLHLNHQNVLPLLIIKNNQASEGTLLRLKTEKKVLQSMIMLKEVQSTNYINKLSLTALKIQHGWCAESEHFLAGSTYNYNTAFLSFLRSLISRSGNKTNNLEKILKLSFLSVNNALDYQITNTIFKDILTLNPKISNKENRQKYCPIFEYKPPSNYLKKQNTSSILTVKNGSVIKEIFPWLNTGKKGLQSIMNQKIALAINDVANAYVSQAAFKISQEFHVGSEFFLTGNTYTNKISVFSFLKSSFFKNGNLTINSKKMLKSSFLPVKKALDYQKTNTIYPGILALNPKTSCVRELLINSEKTSMLNIFKNYMERYLPFKFSTTYTHYLKLPNSEINMEILNSQIYGKNIYSKSLNFDRSPAFIYKENKLKYWPIFEDKSPWNYLGKQNIIPFSIVKKSGICTTGNIFTNKISVFSFLKSLTFKAGNIVTYLNKILKPLHLSENPIYYQPANISTYSEAAEISFQISNYKNNEKFLNSQVLRLNKNHESLNGTRYSAFINRNDIVKNHLTSENKSPAVFLQDILLHDKTHSLNRRFFKESNWVTINKPFVKNYQGNFEHDYPSYVQNKHNYKTRNESLVFHDQGRIEQEIELIKKTIIETKKSVSEKTVPVFGESEIKKYLDINRISSQVYQNIERTIRMERERRGV
jgi:hypothetical protein